jgi:2-dehydro-3-deoxyphosphogluconate aldolase/(4S)-4-hydroxy-2-oxoglutarate aldolase
VHIFIFRVIRVPAFYSGSAKLYLKPQDDFPMNLREFKELPLLGILRGITKEQIEPLTQAVVSAGLRTLEITMNTPGACACIKALRTAAGKSLTVGAGTVLTMADLRSALKSGAEFIVSPVYIPKIVAYCVKNKIPVFPGALTPQEIYTAWESGASMVKVFPAKFFGPEYFKEVKAPLNKVELLACGGVSAQNAHEFFAAGASAVAFGASVFKKEWFEKKEFENIEQAVKEMVEATRSAKEIA